MLACRCSCLLVVAALQLGWALHGGLTLCEAATAADAAAMSVLESRGGAFDELAGGDGEFEFGEKRGGAYRGLLGKRGAYRGLLGKRGAYRGLLGKRGAYRGLLGKRGVYQGLLGKRGSYRGLLGKRGAYRGLLGKRNPHHRLLGKRAYDEEDTMEGDGRHFGEEATEAEEE